MKPLVRKGRDFGQFLKALKRQGKPAYLPFYEHIASPGFIARRTGSRFDRMTPDFPAYWRTYIDFWLGLGYDCIPMEIPLKCRLASSDRHGASSDGSEAHVVFRTMADFEKYAWPDESSPIEFSHFEVVADMLPAGVKIVGGVCAGPYEWASQMLGTVGMAYAIADCPELVEAVFRKLGILHTSAHRQLASMDGIGALRQGDDLGFKTSTFLSPDRLRRHVFPIYKQMADAAHSHDKPFILHSCGNLREVYEDLINDCRIDAKHSFEDGIMPVDQFKKQYVQRITPLGGLDVDTICRSTQDELRVYARRMIENCFADGWWALGTGNSLTDYMPVDNFITILEEGLKVRG
mgnify:CR=1 FL=1